jgi:hypothetical protein
MAPQLRMNKNSLLNQIYICPIGADGVQGRHDTATVAKRAVRRPWRGTLQPLHPFRHDSLG